MTASNLVLIPGAGGVGRTVFEQLRAHDVPVRFMVRREDERADELRALGAEVVTGDLTRPETVAAALQDVTRMYFAMRVSADHLLAATPVASVAREYGNLEALTALRSTVTPDAERPCTPYGDTLTPADLGTIPEADLPPGLPGWMRSDEPWAERQGATPADKRATITVQVPADQRPF
ncbi:NAD(P)H-binding protein [Streptomyces spinosirectus]